MGFPTGPQQSYSNPSGIPGLGGFATTSSDTKSLPNKLGKASSPEPGEIMDATHVHEARMIAMEAKVEKIEKDNDGLRQLVAYLCKGVANLSDNVPNVAQPGTSPSDAAVKKIASDMTAAVLDGVDKSMPKNPETPMSDQVMEDTTGGAENGQSSITVQYLTKSQEKVTKEFLAIQKRLTNLETSFEYHRKSIAKDRRESHDAHDLQKKTSDQIEREIKDFKCTLAFIIEDNDHARRSDLHQRIKITMQMRVFKEQCTHLWEKLVLVAALTGNSSAVKQVIDVQKDLQRNQTGLNFVASKLFNAALAGPMPAQTYHLHQTRRDLHNMRNGRAVIGPNDIHIKLSPEDISMFNGTIDQIEDLFVALKKANPKWEAEIKAQEAKARHASCNYGNGNGNDIPTGPKRPREEDDVHERDRLDRELDRDRDRDDWRDAWQPQQFDRGRQFDRQRNFANQGFDRHDNPKRRR